MAETAIDAGGEPPPARNGDDSPLTPPMLVVWHARPDLRIAFDIATPRGRRGYRAWYARRMRGATLPRGRAGRGPGPLAARLSAARRRIARSLARLPPPLRRPVESARDSLLAARAAWEVRRARDPGPEPPRAAEADPAAPGVRIVGTIRAESGMGQALRSFAGACGTAGVPFALVDAGLRHPSGSVAAAPPGTAADPAALRGNVLFMPFDRVGHAVLALGERAFAGRTNVLVPYWELPRCPPDWRHAAAFFDEIWAPTRFIAEAVAPLSPRVVHMPPCVPPPAPVAFDRDRLGLPRDAFAFFSSFDFLSYPERKNPAAAIAAFRRGFPGGNEPVALLLRGFNVDTRATAWRRLCDAARGDPRIRFSTGPLSHAEVLGLCAACDGYVSLHRSEGFGYGPAEAMLLGKPVVVTGWSGTCDYARDDNACLVRHELVAVRPGQYPHHEGCVWAEPDVEHAAWHMRRLAENPALADDVGRRGRETIRSLYAPEVVGAACRRRLGELGILPE
jgi:glycosyltransferase involved in cell wall biosynthesis